MKSLVVFYSFEGHTRLVAEVIAKLTGADVYELKSAKSTGKSGFLKYFLGGMRASIGTKPKLLEPLPNLRDYARIYIGTPVWASKPAPPLNTFLAGCDLTSKKILLFACSGGGDADKCFDAIKKRLRGGDLLKQLSLSQAEAGSREAVENRVKAWLPAE